MKTVQEWLREANTEAIIETFIYDYPIDLTMLRDKNVTVSEVFNKYKGDVRSVIQYLLSLEPTFSDNDIFYAVYARDGQQPRIKATLSRRSEILTNELPEHYAWDLTPWEEVIGWRVADTSLTLDHMDEVLAHILYELTFFGFKHEEWNQRRAEIETALEAANESAKNGITYSAKEIFPRLGLKDDEQGDLAAGWSSKIIAAEWEYNKYFRIREAAKVRQLLLDESSS